MGEPRELYNAKSGFKRKAALRGLRRRGLDPSAELRSDAHHAELFVARPPEAVREAPISHVLGPLTG